MNGLLWVLQILLALAFFAHGMLFLTPPAEIAVQMDASLPRWFQVFLGVAEIAAAIGITLPGITRIMPGLVPSAATGIIVVMVSATIWHFVRGEISSGFVTIVLLTMACFVAWMRWRVMPIRPRTSRVATEPSRSV